MTTNGVYTTGLHGTSMSSAKLIEKNGFEFEGGVVCFAIADYLGIAHEWGAMRAVNLGEDEYAIISADFHPIEVELWPRVPQVQVPRALAEFIVIKDVEHYRVSELNDHVEKPFLFIR